MTADPTIRRPRGISVHGSVDELAAALEADAEEFTVGVGSLTHRRLPLADRLDTHPPRVSIITCTHNRPDMLRGAAGSVRAQTRGDWEHLVGDAGSVVTAALAEVFEEIAADTRARLHHVGDVADQPARVWNRLLDLARGEYLCFLDDDNGYEPRYVEVMAGTLDAHPETDVVTCGFISLDGGVRLENHLNIQTGELIGRRNTVDTGCFMIRRRAMEAIGYFPEDIRTNEDWAMVRRMASCLRMEHRSECLMTYRVHDGQRMRRCEALGNNRDKVRIEGSAWPGHIDVRVYGPDVPILGQFRERLAEIAWVGDGPEVGVIVRPDMDAGRLIDVVDRSYAVVGVFGATASVDFVKFAIERQRHMPKEPARSVWAVVSREADAVPLCDVLGGRVIVADFREGVYRDRLARVLNCVRSPRYFAEIP